MLTIMTNVAMNNKAGVIGGVAAIVNHYPIDSEWRNDFVRICACIRNVHGSFCRNSRKITIFDRIRLFLEKKRKIMLHFITLSIDVCLFLDYNRQKEGNCK